MSSSSAPSSVAGVGECPSTASSCALNPRYIWNSDISKFIKALDSYAPTLPTEVSGYYLSKSGVNVQDERMLKLVSLAADKFMADIVFDAKQFSVLRQSSQRKDVKRKAVESADTLEFQDLVRSLKMRRISISRPNGFIPGEMIWAVHAILPVHNADLKKETCDANNARMFLSDNITELIKVMMRITYRRGMTKNHVLKC